MRPAVLIPLLLLCCCRPAAPTGNENYIDPTIGNISPLLQATRPQLHRPNQMIRVYPLRKDYTDDQITAFPLQVVGHNAGEVFCIKPVTDSTRWERKQLYDHELEEIHPWYYRNWLVEDQILVEYAPGKKCGMYRFTYPAHAVHRILLSPVDKWVLNGNGEISGSSLYHGDTKVYLYGQFDSPYDAALTFKDSVVALKYAISYISVAAAKVSFEQELAGKGFAEIEETARVAWHRIMNQISVEGGTEAQRRAFFTALYRCHERMVNISEEGAYYSGFDKQVHADVRPFYVDDAAWDTYQAMHPLRMILHPHQEEDMLASYVRMYEQSGWVPQFPRLFGDHACMNGFHSTIIFFDAYRKGLHIADVEKAYEGMKKNALQATMLPWRNGRLTWLDEFYDHNGYYPALRPGEKEIIPEVDTFEKRQAVAVTLGHSYDDWALGKLAKELGHDSDALLFEKRARAYMNLWNAEKGFFMPKDEQHHWIDIDPGWDGGPGGRDYYDENNGWTYQWQVAFDIPGLIQLFGGRERFERKLDTLFHAELGRQRYQFWAKFPDATGLMGQFSMGNEPGFHIPYLYNYVGKGWKTQRMIRSLLDIWFKDNQFGIPGDEDGGGMSAFVVFSSMGFYPVTAGEPVYTIGSPVFSKVVVHLENGKDFTMVAHNCSAVNKYVQGVKMNGKERKDLFFTHEELVNGGTLELEMGDKPSHL